MRNRAESRERRQGPRPARARNAVISESGHFSEPQLQKGSHFGMIFGSPPGVPGGGMTGVVPPPTAGAAMPGSTPAGGQMMPFDRDSRSARSTLPVVSPGVAGNA